MNMDGEIALRLIGKVRVYRVSVPSGVYKCFPTYDVAQVKIN